MIVGEVRASREPLIQATVRGPSGESIDVEAIVDTGFSDYLTLPHERIDRLGLPFLESIVYELANGEDALLDVYEGTVHWDGQWRSTLVSAAGGGPLIGMGLMLGFHLGMDVIEGGRVEITPLA